MNSEDKLIKEFMKKISLNNGTQNNNTQYQYSYVELEEVINNPDEYIIPQCLPTCEVLWGKNIETFMVSNNEDDDLYVLLFNISNQNKLLLEYLIQEDSRYFFDHYRGTYGIRTKGKDEFSTKELIDLACRLQMQDTLRYKSSEEFLEDFKTTGGEITINEYGHIIRKENPEFVNLTLEDALKMAGKEQLYVPGENRVYESPMYFCWHQRYLNSVQSSFDGQKLIDFNNVETNDGVFNKKIK